MPTILLSTSTSTNRSLDRAEQVSVCSGRATIWDSRKSVFPLNFFEIGSLHRRIATCNWNHACCCARDIYICNDIYNQDEKRRTRRKQEKNCSMATSNYSSRSCFSRRRFCLLSLSHFHCLSLEFRFVEQRCESFFFFLAGLRQIFTGQNGRRLFLMMGSFLFVQSSLFGWRLSVNNNNSNKEQFNDFSFPHSSVLSHHPTALTSSSSSSSSVFSLSSSLVLSVYSSPFPLSTLQRVTGEPVLVEQCLSQSIFYFDLISSKITPCRTETHIVAVLLRDSSHWMRIHITRDVSSSFHLKIFTHWSRTRRMWFGYRLVEWH